jgi:hypothetical protein
VKQPDSTQRDDTAQQEGTAQHDMRPTEAKAHAEGGQRHGKKRHGARSPLEWLHMRRHDMLVDAAFAAATVLAEVVLTMVLPPELRTTGGPLAAFGCSALGALPIVLRRAAPWTAVVAFVLAMVAAFTAEAYPLSHQIALFAIGYTAASRCGRPSRRRCCCGCRSPR